MRFPLLAAAAEGHAAVVNCLLEHGAGENVHRSDYTRMRLRTLLGCLSNPFPHNNNGSGQVAPPPPSVLSRRPQSYFMLTCVWRTCFDGGVAHIYHLSTHHVYSYNRPTASRSGRRMAGLLCTAARGTVSETAPANNRQHTKATKEGSNPPSYTELEIAIQRQHRMVCTSGTAYMPLNTIV